MKKPTPDLQFWHYLQASSLLVVLLLCSITDIFAQPQRRGNIWYFGEFDGLDFRCGRPVKIPDANVNSIEGVTTLCNEQGEVLFYTNGGGMTAGTFGDTGLGRIWNRNQEIMLDLGTTSGGGLSSAQGVMALPVPGSATRYYLFTVDHLLTLAEPTHRGLSYFVIDMAANGGLGAVVTGETRIFNPATECLTAARHANGTDYWILTLDYNTQDLLAVQVTAQGVLPPIRYPRTPEPFSFILKVSPDGRFFCDGYTVYRFDAATGAITDPVLLPNIYDYSFSFSPDSRYLYTVSSQLPRDVRRYDLYNTDVSANAEVIASIGNAFVRQMNIGPDGALYFLEQNFPNPDITLSAIYCPDEPLPEVRRNVVSFATNSTSLRFSGMNNLADFWFDNLLHTMEVDTSEHLLCPGIPLELEPNCMGDTYTWSTGETSRTIAVETPGTYRVSVSTGCFTVVETIFANPGEAPSVIIEHQPVDEICDAVPLILTAVSATADTFRWSTGDTLAAITIPAGGAYQVTVSNVCGEATAEVSWPETPCCRLYAPTAFSPNLDGINDKFRLEPFRCPFLNFRLKVFSRWGELLFETDDPAQGWNGRSKNKPLPQGHYVWLATYALSNQPGEVKQEKGGVNLLR